MGSACVVQQPALVADRILSAIQSGNLAEMERGLSGAEQLASAAPPASQTQEQLELLEAVTHQMRDSMRRFRKQLTPHIEGIDVLVGLLRHLAHPARLN